MIQLDTQCVLSELTLFVIQNVVLYVSDLTGPSSGALNSGMWVMVRGIAIRPVGTQS
jgi:hypothetical protein